METKTCSKCHTEKPIDQFLVLKGSTHNFRLSGDKVRQYNPQCRPCKAAAAREWRKANPGYNGTGKRKNIPEEDRLLISAISHRLVCAKVRAKKYRDPIEPNIDRDYLYQLFKEQSGRCALSGALLKVEVGAIAGLSLDKVNPDLGYTKGNVQWLAWAVNRAKGDMPEEVFLDMCRQVLEYQKVQRLSP